MKKLRTKFKIWLSSEETESTFGDGKWRLLKAIDAEGSLKSASDLLHISYRKAWGDLKKAEQCLGITLLDKHRGGALGGRTQLTALGKQWLKAYTRFRSDIERAAEKAYSKRIEAVLK